MPLFTADKIHDGHGWLPAGSTIEVSGTGEIMAVHNRPLPGAVHYQDILCPGFVNVHCHLELSHMKSVVPKHTGLIPFLKSIPAQRNNFTDEQKKAARIAAYNELVQGGTVAVGDIANTTDTLDVRALGLMHCHTFVEALGFNEASAPRSFAWALQSYEAFAAQQDGRVMLQASIAPHAPYSVSAALFRLIDAHGAGLSVSIHNQESQEEGHFYRNKTGEVRSLLSALGIDDSLFVPTGKSSLQSYLDYMPAQRPFIFVHNTYTPQADVQYAHSRLAQVYWCLCPNANLYIENTLPDIPMLISEGAQLCIGTDSLASNHQLSVMAELLTIHKHYPDIGWNTLLTWATANGAAALQMEETIGTIAPGKRPGILQLTGLETIMPVIKRIA